MTENNIPFYRIEECRALSPTLSARSFQRSLREPFWHRRPGPGRPTILLFLFTLSSVFGNVIDQSNLPPVAVPGKGELVKAELIFDITDKPTKECHASTIVETPTGLVVAWFAGTREKDPDVGIWLSRHVNGKWTKPNEVVNGVQAMSVHSCPFVSIRVHSCPFVSIRVHSWLIHSLKL